MYVKHFKYGSILLVIASMILFAMNFSNYILSMVIVSIGYAGIGAIDKYYFKRISDKLKIMTMFAFGTWIGQFVFLIYQFQISWYLMFSLLELGVLIYVAYQTEVYKDMR